MKVDEAAAILDAELARSMRSSTQSQAKRDWENALNMAVAELRRGVAVKVKHERDTPDEMGFYIAVCPNCISEVYRLRDEAPEKFCITCGQRLEWAQRPNTAKQGEDEGNE